MAFKKGYSGNPTGKPKGAKNKTTLDLRKAINDFLNENFEKIKSDIDSLEPKDRVKIYIDLLQYGLPKLQTVRMDFENKNPIPELITGIKIVHTYLPQK